MIYVYACQGCKLKQDVHKSIDDIERREDCPECSLPMNRMLQPIGFNNAKVFEPHFNHGIGKVVTSQRDVKENIARLRGETGRDIVEVGTDSLGSVKKVFKSYDDVYKELAPKY